MHFVLLLCLHGLVLTRGLTVMKRGRNVHVWSGGPEGSEIAGEDLAAMILDRIQALISSSL
jgi:hypothetical protein